jgi:hypothetical protein
VTWRYAATSVTGTSHKASLKECQDAHRCAHLRGPRGNSVLAVVVSDGAGSAQAGAVGAAIVTSGLLARAEAWVGDGQTIGGLNRATFLSWLDGVRESIAEGACSDNLQMRDYAATLLFAMVDEHASVFAQIGDGALVTSDGPRDWAAQFWPQHGPYANQTYFVTDLPAHGQLSFAHGLQPVDELAVFTDGLERVLLDFAERRAHVPVFEKMLHPLRNSEGLGHVEALSAALTAYLTSAPIVARADDDLTLVIASRRRAASKAA